MLLCEQKLPGNRKRWFDLEGIHDGESCFVLGNGPSLRAADLDVLWEKKIPCFASNRIYLIYDQTRWRPDYYTCVDMLVFSHFKDEVVYNQDIAPLRFFPCSAYTEFDYEIGHNSLYVPVAHRRRDLLYFSNTPKQVLYLGRSVIFCMMELAYYMGFKNIYLLGVDHNYATKTEDDGRVVLDTSKIEQSYFSTKYRPPKEEVIAINLDAQNHGFQVAANFAQENELNIYNATRGGALEVFPRVDFDEVIEKI